MNTDFTFAPWGMTYAALMYVIGNGVWTNYLVRQKPWAGWLMWSISAALIVIAGAAIQLRLGGGDGVWAIISSTSSESHWIVVTLYALLSIPGAASILFRQSVDWTRFGILATALLVFIPLGAQLNDPASNHLVFSLGITLAVCSLMWVWSLLLDCEPEHKRKTIPIKEMSQ